jgi:DNA invertase Pin-like site-specific DNA recombinase
MQKFIGYIRVSTDKQNHGLYAQLNNINNFIKNKGELLAYYQDKASGKLDIRLGLNDALEHCKKEGATLLIAKLDRLSKNVVFLFQIKNSGVDIACCDLPELNTLTLGIFATMAQHERELISKRTKEGMEAAKKKGKKIGRKKGYIRHQSITEKINAAKKIKSLTINQKAAKAALHFKNKGLSNYAIANELNQLGFVASRGGQLESTQIRRILNIRAIA